MRPLFHPTLVNGPTGDPVVYIDCLFQHRALLFDLGDIQQLPPRKILRVSDVFVSHTHMDHFIGFDWLLRVCLGRGLSIRLYGPPGFVDQVGHRLGAYTWNLVEGYDTDLTLDVTEAYPDGSARCARFRCKAAFRREGDAAVRIVDGVLRDEEFFSVRCAFLDHKIPCLGFALHEKQHLNVWKNRLDELGLPTGPWLQELKRAARAGAPDDTPIRAWWRIDGVLHERRFTLGFLKSTVLEFVPGQKIAYVTDTLYDEPNARRIVDLARGADVFFIETPFLQQDAARAASRHHLTAHQAGTLATLADAKSVVPFHFSPRYDDGGDALRAEAMAAFGAAEPEPTHIEAP